MYSEFFDHFSKNIYSFGLSQNFHRTSLLKNIKRILKVQSRVCCSTQSRFISQTPAYAKLVNAESKMMWATEFGPENKQSKRSVMTPEKSNIDDMMADFLVLLNLELSVGQIMTG